MKVRGCVLGIISVMLFTLILFSFERFSSTSGGRMGESNMLYGQGSLHVVREDLLNQYGLMYDDRYIYWTGIDENISTQMFRVKLEEGGKPEYVCQRNGCNHVDPDCVLHLFYAGNDPVYFPYILDQRLVYATEDNDENKLSVYAMDMQGKNRTCVIETELYMEIPEPETGKTIQSQCTINGIKKINDTKIAILDGSYLVITDESFNEITRVQCIGSRVVSVGNDLFWMSGKQFINYDVEEGKMHRDILEDNLPTSGEYFGYDGKLYYYSEGWLCTIDAETLENERVIDIEINDTEATVNPFYLAEGIFLALTDEGLLQYDLANGSEQTISDLSVLPFAVIGGKAYFDKDDQVVVRDL